ncbi:MAG: hypothetical protein M3Q97_05670 [Bacteroidota bacterium]|nr:hypothetical protein [Bacteroidota bacterium]
MTTKEIIIGLTIHLLLPLTGLLWFLKVQLQMKKEKVPNAPAFELFILFATYGGLLLVALTTLFWQWSGMASLGTFYLIFGAPVAMGLISYRHRQSKNNSKYHNRAFVLGLLYFVIAPVAFIILFSIS